MKEVVKVAFIGLGGRGLGLLKQCLLRMHNDVEIVAVCDTYEDRAQAGKSAVKHSKRGNTPIVSTNYKDVIGIPEADCVIIATSWEDHIKIAIEAMKLGKIVGCEVGGAYHLQDCYDLVKAFEETGKHCMMLENCNYGEYELMVLNMVKKGLFGEIVYAEGAYGHDIRAEIANGDLGNGLNDPKHRHYRLRNYRDRNCENYPTHEIGPIAKVLKINNGNRFVSLTSFGSKSAGLKDYIRRHYSNNNALMNLEFKQNDIITTVLQCENGETVTIFLDTTLPRFYSRRFTIHGTRALYQEDGNILYLDNHYMSHNQARLWNNAKKYLGKYGHELWSRKNKKYRKFGHGGMDWFVLRAFIETVKNDAYPPIDTYDTATYMAITPLSEISLQKNSSAVEFPDFTKGKYKNKDISNILPEFALDW